MPDEPSPLNNATTPTGETGDGAALYATAHPKEVTEAMLIAGKSAYTQVTMQCPPGRVLADVDHTNALRAAYIAMRNAEPELPDISEDAIETVQVEFGLPDHVVERFAIRVALGNNGGEWLEVDGKQHYTDKQKDHWRQFIRDLAEEVRAAHTFKMVDEDYGREF